MFTISLMFGCYDDEVFKREITNLVKNKAWGYVSRITLLNEESGYYRFTVDVTTRDPEGLIFELEMYSCGHETKPEEMATVNFDTLSYRIVAMPDDVSMDEIMGLMNQSFNNQSQTRSTCIQLLMRMEQLEQTLCQLPDLADNSQAINQMADVINTIAEKTFGHKMIEIDNRNNYEVKPKWLH